MLSPQDDRLLDEKLSSSDHDHFFWAGLLGEPFLVDGILSYFDAETSSIVGAALDGDSIWSADWQNRLHNAIARTLDQTGARFLSYWGPYQLPADAVRGWSLVFAEDPVACNVDVFLHLAEALEGLNEKKTRETLRHARRSGIDLWIGSRPALNADHLTLLRHLAGRDGVGVQDVYTLANVVSILCSDVTDVFEARCGGRLVGFAVAHRYFKSTAFAVVAAFDHSFSGCSDLIIAAMVEHYARRGAKRLGLGYAYDPGSLAFKTKWKGATVAAPFYELIWQRPNTEMPFNGCLRWPWRLLSKQLACGGRCDESEWLSTPAELTDVTGARKVGG